jgi:hypothetical protein
MQLRRTALVGLVGVAVASGGCGSSSSGVSATAYVRAVCNAVGAFESDVRARSDALNRSTITSPAKIKVTLRSFLSAIAIDTGTALARLRAAGTPDVAGGGRIESAIVDAFAQGDKAMRSAATSAEALPTASAGAFKAAATTLGTTVRNSVDGIGTSLSGLKSPALQKAALKEPACKKLSSGY